LTNAKPARQAIVALELADGRVFERRTFAVRGTPDNPMTPAEVEAKATELIAPVIGAVRAAELVQAVMTLDDIADVASLNPLLRAG
jgi:2-methylcitrate dehydratase PrpD